ncbi:MAG: Gfo/Idh/MocA family oxidoreductase [Elusimicrobia bacterium]|nr:Gfo/Idh/MocA family oxidoreductase [Candidatus Obscuribacterium magneticum]
MTNKRFRAAIVGLGQVGLLFDDDKRREGVWTHFTAYERLNNRFDLVAVCELDPEKIKKALKRKNVRAYKNLPTMLERESLDIVSLCTPPQLHAQHAMECAGKVRAIICEKPLGTDLRSCRQAVYRCRKQNTLLAVNYYKRFEGTIEYLKKQLLNKNRLGRITQALGYYSGPFEAVGSHMVDLARYLLGELEVIRAYVSSKEDKSFGALMKNRGRTLFHLIPTGKREDLIFEIDIVGRKGRCRVVNNCGEIQWGYFERSKRYSGYRELTVCPSPRLPKKERFLPLFSEVAGKLSGDKTPFTCDGEEALKTQELISSITNKATHGKSS